MSKKSARFNTQVNLFRGDSGKCIAHLPLRGSAFVVDEPTVPIIQAICDGDALPQSVLVDSTIGKLGAMGLLGDPVFDEPRLEPLNTFQPTEATLIFTETCNLGCTYCYSSSKAEKTPPMSAEIMRAAVDTVCENAAKTEGRLANFRFIGGGEPTVEWKFLQESVRYIKEASESVGVNHCIRLVTNGTLLTEDRIEWLANGIQFVTLSFDILPELQAERPYAGGRSTHEALLRVSRNLVSRGVPFHIRTTISVAGASRLVDMVRYVHENIGSASIRFEPMSLIGRSVPSGLSRPPSAEFVDSFKAAYKIGKKLGVDVTCKMLTNVKRSSSRFCDAEFSVNPGGKVSGCHRYSKPDTPGYDMFQIGMFNGREFEFDMGRINELLAVDVHTFAECSSCMARWNCAGGCLSARVNGGGVSQSGPLCELTRDLLKFAIEEKIGANQ